MTLDAGTGNAAPDAGTQPNGTQPAAGGNATPDAQKPATSLMDGSTAKAGENVGQQQATDGQADKPSGNQDNNQQAQSQQEQQAQSLRLQIAQFLPEDEREAYLKEANRYPTDADFAKAHVGQRKALSKMYRIPEEGDTDGWRELHKKLGAPDEPDKYELRPPKGFSEEDFTETDKTLFAEAKTVFHETGLPQKTVDRLVEMQLRFNRVEAEARAAQGAALDEERMTQYKVEWAGDFETNKATFLNTLTYTLPPDEIEKLKSVRLEDGSLMVNHPAFVRSMVKLGRERINDDFDLNPINADRKTNAKEELDRLNKEMIEKNIRPGDPRYPADRFEQLYRAVGSTQKRSGSQLSLPR